MIIPNPVCAPSSVNWCEHDFAVSPYIAEFWNTVSGFSIFISAICWYWHMYPLHKCLTNIFKWLVVVSVGTSLFHATLLYKYQILDELPMLVIAMEYVNILTTLDTITKTITPTQLHIVRTIYNIGKVLIFAIPFTYFVDPLLQIGSFHVTLKVFEIIVILLLRQLHITSNNTIFSQIFSHTHIHGDDLYKYKASSSFAYSQQQLNEYLEYKRQISFHTKRGVTMYSSSILLWVIERIFCNYIEFLQLHAWWHVLSSIGVFHLNMILTFHIKINNIIENIEKTK
jgi:hypothetical protein